MKNGKTMQIYANLFFFWTRCFFIQFCDFMVFSQFHWRWQWLYPHCLIVHAAVCVVILVCFSFRPGTERKLFELCMFVAPFVQCSCCERFVVEGTFNTLQESGQSGMHSVKSVAAGNASDKWVAQNSGINNVSS